VSEVLDAVFLAARKAPEPFEVFNVATGDYITVTEIADLAVEVAGLAQGSVEYSYAGGDRGWRGDVPVVRLNTDRIRSLGWGNHMNTRAALKASLVSMLEEERAGLLT
jgi:UDP-glucose 4-epimerase